MAFVGVIAASLLKTRAVLAEEQHSLAVVETTGRITNRMQRLATYLTISASDLEKATAVDISQGTLRNELNNDFLKLAALAKNDAEARELLIEQQKFLARMDGLYRRDILYGNNSHALRLAGMSIGAMTFRQNVLTRYDSLLNDYKQDRTEKENESAREIEYLKRLVLSAAFINLGAGIILAIWFSRGLLLRIKNLSGKMDNIQTASGEYRDSADFRKSKKSGDLDSSTPKLIKGDRNGDELDQIESSFSQLLADIETTKANQELLVAGASDVICTIDRQGNILDINSACSQHWGRDRRELIGDEGGKNNPAALQTILSPDSVSAFKLDTTTNGALSTMDLQILAPDGEMIDTRWTCYWSKDEDSAFCFVQDVRETNRKESLLRQAEEQVTALIKNLPVGIIVVDAQERVKSYNRKLEELAGLSPAPATIQLDLERLIQVDALDKQSLLQRAIKNPNMRAYLRTPNRATNIDQRRIAVELTVEKLNENDDCLLIVEDVRERARLEKVKKDFVALLQDNLRTPLVQLRADMKEVSQRPGDERTAAKLKRIVSNSERLIQLIDGLIKVETLRPDKIVGELKPIAVGEILETAISSLSDYALAQGITVSNSSSSSEQDSRQIILADSERLTQVVINLLSNAIKFSPARGTVTVAATVYPNFVEVSVSDQGRGIDEQQQATIFEPYVQAQQKDKYQGTGLGLAICKTIIAAHGGVIRVTSAVSGDPNQNQGSRFWFQLPLQGGR